MAYEISLENRTAKIDLLYKNGSKILIAVDDNKYEIDIMEVEKGVFSILHNGNSYNLELIEGSSGKKYIVNTFSRAFNVEIIDAEAKYQHSRNQGHEHDGENDISSPMPGKVVKIPVSIGESVKTGQTLIVVEAMKMQSEFKAKSDRIVKDILVKEGSTVDSNQVMIRLE